MNYPFVKIDGMLLSDIWEQNSGYLLTIGQIAFILQQIDKQMQGAGSSLDPDYWNYWLNSEGEPVEKK